MANIQKTVIKATVALTEAAEHITKFKGKLDNRAKIITSLTDAMALLGHASYDMSLRRRDAMRPSINKELRSLCKPTDTSL